MRACEAAVAARDASLARAHLAEARAATGEDHLKLRLLEGDILRLEGDEPAAEEALCAAQRLFPGNHWPLLKLAQLCRDQHRPGAARMFAAQARRLEGAQTAPHLMALEAEICQMEGDRHAACALLIDLQKAHPDTPLARPVLGKITRQLVQDRDPVAVIPLLTELLAAFGPRADLALPLARAHDQLGQQDKVEAILTALPRATLATPAVLRFVINNQIPRATPDRLLALADLIGETDPALARQSRIDVLCAAGRFDEALPLIKAAPIRFDSPAPARQLALVLFGMGRNGLALRYLRVSLQRWPADAGLLALAFHKALALGHLTLAREVLEQARPVLPDAELAGFQLRLASQAGDLESGLSQYSRLRHAGRLTLTDRALMANLLFCKADPGQLDQIRGQIDNPGDDAETPLHRGGRAGMLMLELELETRNAPPESSDPLEWCRTRPESTAAAIRLIDSWMAQAPMVAAAPDTHPRQIFQYSEDDSAPAAIASRMQSWRDLKGYNYQLLSRSDARALLRGSFGPKWVQAFDLCRDPEERADLLRCCLLIHRGGIWARPEALLYGDLQDLAGQEGQLVLGRELLGGFLETGFMVAPAGHPVLIYAAKQIRQSLLQRSADIAWNKTGAGVLTRACGQFIVQHPTVAAGQALHILPADAMARVVDLRSPVAVPCVADTASAAFWPAILGTLRQSPDAKG